MAHREAKCIIRKKCVDSKKRFTGILIRIEHTRTKEKRREEDKQKIEQSRGVSTLWESHTVRAGIDR